MKTWPSTPVQVILVAAGFVQHSSCRCWDGTEGSDEGTNTSTCKQKATR